MDCPEETSMQDPELWLRLLQGGVGNLAAYLAAHVLLCLVPAFYIAGAMTALIPKETITRFLGRRTPAVISYPAAALAGSVLAVCSCTIVPLFAGIYKKGAGLGPAITFLFFAPAANILALVYTGGIIGVDLAFARLLLSLAFGISIGIIMAAIFRRSDSAHDADIDAMFVGGTALKRSSLVFLLVLVALLLSGTLKIPLLQTAYANVSVPLHGLDRAQLVLADLVPFDSTRGEEGVTAQGAILVVLLGLIALASWKGFETIFDGPGAWTWAALALTATTLLFAACGVVPGPARLQVAITGRFVAVALGIASLAILGKFGLTPDELTAWLWESWRFMKQIFPLLVAGVFAVGLIRVLIQPEWIRALAGENSLLGNAAGVAFGVFMYFPTLVEVPIARMFLDLGMHRGPLLAYLMADPELSLQSILMLSAILGRVRAWTYVGWVAIFSVIAGLIYGTWVDHSGAAAVIFLLIGLATVTVILLGWFRHRWSTSMAVRPS